jgi:hypothetical protein
MKKYQLGPEYSKEAIDSTKKHLKMIGKDATSKESTELLDVIVRNNPNFPNYDSIEDIVEGFFSAVHYGSHELKNASLLAHTRSFGEWIKNRSTIRPVEKQEKKSGKPDDWQYDPNEPLPGYITREKARELLYTIHEVYGNEIHRVTNSPNFVHYVNKLKHRFHTP